MVLVCAQDLWSFAEIFLPRYLLVFTVAWGFSIRDRTLPLLRQTSWGSHLPTGQLVKVLWRAACTLAYQLAFPIWWHLHACWWYSLSHCPVLIKDCKPVGLSTDPKEAPLNTGKVLLIDDKWNNNHWSSLITHQARRCITAGSQGGQA